MDKLIQKGKVYKGRSLSKLACMALEDAYELEDFILVKDLKNGQEFNTYAHQLELMQEDYAIEYTQSEMKSKYPDWEADEIDIKKLDQHIFTFGIGHLLWDKYAVIQASSPDRARDAMFSVYGQEWAMQYTTKEFARAKSQGFFHNLESLPTIFCESR